MRAVVSIDDGDAVGYSLMKVMGETPDGGVVVNIPVEDVTLVGDIWEELVVALGYEHGAHLTLFQYSKVEHGVPINPDQSTIYDHLSDIHDEVSRAPLDR